MGPIAKERVIAYIDGFNLYFGLREKGYRRYYWLNLKLLAQNLLRTGQELVATKYFTARISGPAPTERTPLAKRMKAKQRRQSVFLDALGTLTDFTVFYGHYLDKTTMCKRCGNHWPNHEEKMTDVNIATQLLRDAFQDKFDAALLISADSDLVPPIRTLRELFPAKRIVVVFPPARFSEQLKRAAHAYLTLGRANLAKSQFPDELTKADGFTLRCPTSWK